MLRDHLISDRLRGEAGFRWRGREISRVEGFSDAVFAFAVTLLVVSLEVPKTYHELMAAMRGFAAFGACFALLANLWFQHYRFFRRYGLQDSWSVILNCVLLFFVLFYVYPLKFLFLTWFGDARMMELAEVRTIFIIFGGGFAAVFLVFALLNLHAWQVREELQLNELEEMKTLHQLANHVAMVLVGLLSIVLAVSLPLNLVGLAGYFYALIGVYFWVSGTFFGNRERSLSAKGLSAAPAAESPQ